jgi:hypothetical protein
MHRREVLQVLAASAGVACLDGFALDEMLAFGRRLHATPRKTGALSAHQSATVTVVAERIIPRSETPGATDAGVTAFIDHMLADWYEPAERDRVLVGLAELDARSRALDAQDFVGLPEADQVALLTGIDGEVAANDHWFAMLKFLTVWGYFTSEAAQRQTLGAFPLPMRYEACAPYQPPAGRP